MEREKLNKIINFDPSDWESMEDLMDKLGNSKYSYFGKNENNEDVRISINTDNIVVETTQLNNWIRVNIYHRDGTVEELYEKGER